MGSGSQQVLHGVVINKHPKLLPQRFSALRSAIHKLAIGNIPLDLLEDYTESLSGAIATVAAISPRQGRKLQISFDAALRQAGDRSALVEF